MGKTMLKENGSISSLAMSAEDSSRIPEFFQDRCVFITGATGFLGKVLLEKLMRSCSRVKTIYLLLRPKEGEEPRQRLDDLLSCQVFDRVRKQQPSVITKVVPISGDISLPGMGISQSDVTLLANNVSIVFHSAATIRFDEPLKKAACLNLVGTKQIMQLCQKMKNLIALVHVSTAYCHCNREEIDEMAYPEPVPPEKIIDATEWMDEELLNCITPHLLSGRPTTYHFTKALAEDLLTRCGDLPVAIVRPSIVTAAWKEPLPGWVDNLYGPSGYLEAKGKGYLRTMLVHRNATVDMIPVDLVVNTLIAVAWYTATYKPNSAMIYNCTSGSLNRITWGEMERIAHPLIIRHPSMEVMRYPGGSFKSSRFMNEVSIHLEHSLPAYLLDFIAWLTGHKTGMVQMCKRLQRVAGFLEYFTTREWSFSCNNMIALMNELSSKDKEMFSLDVRFIDWNSYMEDYILGLRRFALKEDESTLPAARRKLKRIYYLGKFAKIGVLFGVVHILLARISYTSNLWWSLLTLCLRIGRYIPVLLSLS